MNSETLHNWDDLTLQHVFYAYRKAKSDCYFERSIVIAEKFVEFEKDIASKLTLIYNTIKSGQIQQLLLANLGYSRVVAKKLTSKKKESSPHSPADPDAAHIFFSDPERAFQHTLNASELTPEFRIVGDFPVVMHILCALWINLVGHKFDEKMSSSSYGSRLRRYRPDNQMQNTDPGRYHLEALGSFQQYFQPYKRWREGGLGALRRELEAGQPVIAISMDLTSYYHQIDPSFIASEEFHAVLGVKFTPLEKAFTEQIALALTAWADKTAKEIHTLCGNVDPELIGGLPIGLSAARLMANVLLFEIDRDIEQGLAPVYYGRYVDDIFLVLRDPGNLKNVSDLYHFMAARVAAFPQQAFISKAVLKLSGNYKGKSKLTLQSSKQKAFFLKGRAGLDLLSSIESQIRSVSSERRIMPSPEHLESMASAKVLTAAGSASDEADTLRRADGLSVRRLGWSIQLRAVETLARDLPPEDWREERNSFYEFARSHILRADKILDHIDYLPRLLSLSVGLGDWKEALGLVQTTLRAIAELAVGTAEFPVKVNGCEASQGRKQLWTKFNQSVRAMAADAVLRAIPWSSKKHSARPIPKAGIELSKLLDLQLTSSALQERALEIREADWSKAPYKHHLRYDANEQRKHSAGEETLAAAYPNYRDLQEFLDTSGRLNEGGAARLNHRCGRPTTKVRPSFVPFLFPTRPYSTQEISLFLPQVCVFGEGDSVSPARAWARFVRAVRGVWVWDVTGSELNATTEGNRGRKKNASAERRSKVEPKVALLECNAARKSIFLGITSLETSDDTWSKAAAGTSDLSRDRYERVRSIVNQAISARPRPTHLLLPELSIPEQWIDTVSQFLRGAGISLIAGLDYQCTSRDRISSSAVLVLEDDRLGFPSSVQIRQMKAEPAPTEEKHLLHTFGRKWYCPDSQKFKPIYEHQGFSFGVLVCSELQNVGYRQDFQGRVDCLIVLAWNQDLETFTSLVESASLDVHASIALVNNRRYGDSRVRVPAKASHQRDACRLRGGANDYVVVVQLDMLPLRSFQSRAKRWPSENDAFKPTPEGFKISHRRRVMPQ